MALGLYLTLDQNTIFNGNFSDVSAFKLTGTIYTDVNRTTPLTLSGYTITMKIYRDGGYIDRFAQTCTITSSSGGTFYLSVTTGTLPYAGLYLVVMELTKSGTQISTMNRQELLIEKGPQ